MGLTLDETLSLTEKLQQMEARALAAEMALCQCRDTCALYHEGDDSSLKAIEQVAFVVNQYVKDRNLDAARELMRKAEEWGKWCSLFVNHYKRPSAELDEVESHYMLGFLEADKRARVTAKEEADTLRRQLAESEAMVERMREFITEQFCRPRETDSEGWTRIDCDHCDGNCFDGHTTADCPARIAFILLRDLTPAAALSEYRREVLKEVAKLVIDHELCYLPATPHPETMSIGEALAAEIRAMGEGK